LPCFAGCNERDRDYAGRLSQCRPCRPDARRIDASLHAAEDYLNVGDLVNAEAILTRLVDRAPDDPRGFEMLAHTQLSRGVTARSEGDLDAATVRTLRMRISASTRVIELSPA
jgi:predicted Zn-dependent protease